MSSRHYIVITGQWKGVNGATIVVNVYAPQSKLDKIKLWSYLINLKRNPNGIWIFLGDFNAVRKADERINSRFCHRTAKDFNEFIKRTGLQEFNLGGKKITYMCDDDLKLSKFDRIMVCSNFIAQ